MADRDGRTVVVTGMGVVSPIGSTCRRFWSSLMTGQCGVAPVRSFDTEAFPVHIGCEVRAEDMPPEHARDFACGRTTRLAIDAGYQAISNAKLREEDLCETGLCLGTTMGEASWLEAWPVEDVVAGPHAVPAEELLRSDPAEIGLRTAERLGLGGQVTTLAGACAAGNYAIGRAIDLVRLGYLERVLAGGADAFSRIAFTGFARLGALASETCRPFSRDRDGIVLGEGAAMLVIESLRSADRRGAPILAEAAGYGLSCDAHHIVSPHPDGSGILRAMESALDDARMMPEMIHYICAHGTGTRANDSTEVTAVRRLFAAGDREVGVPMSSIKALTGHGLGAASAIEAVASVLALEHQTLPPTWNFREPDPEAEWDVVPNAPRRAVIHAAMNNAAAFGGNNAVTIFRNVRPKES